MARSTTRRGPGAPSLRRTVSDLRALAHPLRLRMMELFAESPKTTKQVADLLGEPPTRLYHHVAALERAGLLVLKETRQNRGAVEKWYAGVAQQIQDSPRSTDGTQSRLRRKARRAVAATALEQAKQEVMAIPAGAREPALVGRVVLVAPAATIARIRQRLLKTVQSMREELEREEGAAETDCARWALTVAFAPVASPRRSRSRS
jgi:DNA-binding transcriptional ArsR family regulator